MQRLHCTALHCIAIEYSLVWKKEREKEGGKEGGGLAVLGEGVNTSSVFDLFFSFCGV